MLRRDDYLEQLDQRFWSSGVLMNRDGVGLTIIEACGSEHPFRGHG